jgi:hypothetical protein
MAESPAGSEAALPELKVVLGMGAEAEEKCGQKKKRFHWVPLYVVGRYFYVGGTRSSPRNCLEGPRAKRIPKVFREFAAMGGHNFNYL